MQLFTLLELFTLFAVSMMTAFKKSELAESDRAIASLPATDRYGLTTTSYRLLLPSKYRPYFTTYVPATASRPCVHR